MRVDPREFGQLRMVGVMRNRNSATKRSHLVPDKWSYGLSSLLADDVRLEPTGNYDAMR